MTRKLVVGTIMLAATALGWTGDHLSFEVKVHGQGRPMILIPGLTNSGEVWDDTVKHFSSDFEIHVLSLAGFGDRPPIAGPFLPTVRDEIISYVRKQKLENPIVMGHSLGGFMAFWLASTEPDMFGPVVAVDGVPFLPALMDPAATEDAFRSHAERMKTMMASLTKEQFAMQNRMTLATMIKDPADVERIARTSSESDPTAVAQAVFEIMTTDLRDDVASITKSVLLIAAGESARTDAARDALKKRYQAQVAQISKHRLVVAEQARHYVMIDEPDLFYATVDAFLKTCVTVGKPQK